MTDKLNLTWDDVHDRAKQTARLLDKTPVPRLYPVPRGGIPAAQAVSFFCRAVKLVERPEDATHMVDDIIDSGATRERYRRLFPNLPFHALVDKTDGDAGLPWVVFPWERMTGEQNGPQENIRRLIQLIGDDPAREGLIETPDRVLRSYAEIYGGYQVDPASVLKVFTEGACDEMVVMRGVEFASMCEHHMLPFVGQAHIGYIPRGRIVGISKLVRLLEVYSRRLQVQERLTEQITTALDEHLMPLGSACVIEAKHFCMVCRGVCKQNAIMITSSLTGAFREKPEARAEFMAMVR